MNAEKMRIKKRLYTLRNQNSDVTQFLKGISVLADDDAKHKIDAVVRTLEHQQVIIDDLKELTR